ncbi:hypothetical protein [Thermomonas paludicola]|uniref:hypothetical protein n=1 Tax=Thermomonas paludicola TaxID=2884874 RepID=UPI002113E227|nr:hypothetical protein [Thermomonas paludicola]
MGSLKSAAIGMVLGAMAQGVKSRQTGGKYASGASTESERRATGSQKAQYAEPAADTIRDDVWLQDKVKQNVSIDPATGEMLIRVPYALEPGTSVDIENDFVTSVEGALSRDHKNGVFDRNPIRLKVDLVRDDVNGIFTLAACSPAECNATNGIRGAASYNASNKQYSRVEILGGTGYGTSVHEFLHMMGLGHQLNATSSIMSYQFDTRRLKYSDVSRLYNAYK